MSDDGEKTCPLCAEEMDLTDQQLKPCKCGYEICIWCWHHIIEMTEKEDTEAQCPACRTPYNKDRVLKAAAANSKRIIAEIFSEKKQRPQRAKTKISAEAMKHLSGVRVMQKNLVYITGLPINLCDESILERKEYFGQYGKVLKVSISRAPGTSSQKTSTYNTFGIYVTYAKEEEAVQCTQGVHNYVLEGKSLRACFGTTKYCHAWLRNITVPMIYLRYLLKSNCRLSFGLTWSRVPQITSSSSQRRFRNVLPPPMDDFNSRLGLDKHPVKRTCNNSSIQVKGSSNISAEKSNALPAAASWGLHGSNCQILASSIQCSQTPATQNTQAINNSSLPSLLTTSTKQPSARDDEMLITSKVPESKEDVRSTSGSLEPLRLDTRADSRLTSSLEIVNNVDNAIVTSKPVEQIKMADLDDRSSQLVSMRSDFDRQQQTLLSSTQVAPVMIGTSQVPSSCLSDSLAVALEDKEGGSVGPYDLLAKVIV
ncbi:RNA recognition [Musa troglodytarum]|uniref:RNA recognition n=1 Tax=Musa troglodytarum TaxID=320322 RepID=A0A9E7G6P8_9LILI|nr:RNA recognition [Musa troglodytarum]